MDAKVLVRYLRDMHSLLIGELTAQSIIRELTAMSPVPKDWVEEIALRGRHLITGLPTGIMLSRYELRNALSLPQASGSSTHIRNFTGVLRIALPTLADAKLLIMVYRSR